MLNPPEGPLTAVTANPTGAALIPVSGNSEASPAKYSGTLPCSLVTWALIRSSTIFVLWRTTGIANPWAGDWFWEVGLMA